MLGGMKRGSVQRLRPSAPSAPSAVAANQSRAPSAEPSLFIYAWQARLVRGITASLHGQKAAKAWLNAGL